MSPDLNPIEQLWTGAEISLTNTKYPRKVVQQNVVKGTIMFVQG